MKNIFFALGTIFILAIGLSILPIDKINWGRISVLPAATITVTGTSEGNIANSQASFGATVTAVDPDKQTAVNSVNTKMTTLISSLKNFGIADADIKTDSVNVIQMPVPQTQTLIYPAPPQQIGNGNWQASNSITITLRDVSKASGLTDLLNTSGATSIYGPNFNSGNNTATSDADLLSKAVADAKSKAEAIAKAGGQTLGKMINVQENGTNSIVYPMGMMAKSDLAPGAPVQPGTTNLSKSVTVIYELK